jgi:mannose-6-phosphate isomerase class I
MDQENEKMVTVTLKIPERVGKILWILGDESFAAINGFEEMEAIKQFAYIADVANFMQKLKDGLMVGTFAALMETVSDIANDMYEDDDDEGALH